jgi:hypothetical protein
MTRSCHPAPTPPLRDPPLAGHDRRVPDSPDRTLDRVRLAARNNALWCDAVCRTHGIAGSIDDVAWSAPTRTPPFYPDAVTLSPDVGEYDVLARIDPSDGCSVKDSWSRLDLSVEDFARLVVGEWLWHHPSEATTAADGRRWRRVTTADELATWVEAWAADDDATRVLRPALLDEPGVHLLAADGPGSDIVAGCIVNVTGAVAGISNLFDRDGDLERTWRGAVTAARQVARGIPLVGWDAGDGVTAAVAAGCERIGPLTVWIR